MKVDEESITEMTDARLNVETTVEEHAHDQFKMNVFYGLSSTPKRLSPKYFYDARGSQLFEQICELPEYYPTRTEKTIIEDNLDEIVGDSGHEMVLVEFGSGSSVKTQLIIEACLRKYGKLHYAPIDISESILRQASENLLSRFQNLKITGLASDYTTGLATLKKEKIHRKLILFLGSSIGNFTKNEARDFLLKIRETMYQDDRFLVGMDLLKSKEVLTSAYDDAAGVTAQFNLNLLQRMNEELGADFDLTKFRHKVVFNEAESRIEMHLESTEEQSIYVESIDCAVEFAAGETIHTENSYKFSPAWIQQLASLSGFDLAKTWTDENDWFSLNLMIPV